METKFRRYYKTFALFVMFDNLGNLLINPLYHFNWTLTKYICPTWFITLITVFWFLNTMNSLVFVVSFNLIVISFVDDSKDFLS